MMSIDIDKIKDTTVEQITFFRSYYEAGELLENDTERGFFYSGILKYAFSNGSEIPDFSQDKVMQMGWTVIQKSLDKSLNNRRPGNTNAKKAKNANETRIKRDSNTNTVYDIDIDKDIDKKESSKETAESFSLTPEPEKKIPFTRWTEQQFREDVERYSDYRDHWEKFISYWTEPDGKGKMRFQKEKTWDTGRRLARWADNQKPVPEEESRNYQRAF